MTKGDIVKEFSSIKGIGKAKAELIYDNGFTSIDQLKKASIEDLTKIKGITKKIATEVLKQLAASSKKEIKKPNTKKDIQDKKSDFEKKTADGKTKKIEKNKVTKDIKPEEKSKDEDETETSEEEKIYKAKKKPKLSKELRDRLKLRKQIKNRTPEFLREEWYRYKKLPKNWRKPDGITSKMRINLKYRPSMARVGFRGPRETRHLHPSGFKEVAVYNVKDIEKLNPETQAARIGSTVGTKKRLDIQKRAEELDIRILNRS